MNGDITPQDLDAWVRTVAAEAGDDPDGQLAVANVIGNRVSSGQYGRSPGAVVTAPGQFEVWQNGTAQSLNPNSPKYKNAAEAVANVITGLAKDNTGGATHFYSPGGQRALGRNAPAWASGQPNASIGGQLFYAPNGPVKKATQQSGPDVDALMKLYGGSADAAAPQAVTSDPSGPDVDALAKLYGGEAPPAGESKSASAAPSEWWQGHDEPGTVGAAERVGIGAARGGKDVLDTLAHGLAGGTDAAAAFLASKGFLPQSMADAVHGSAQDAISTDQQGNKLFDAAYGDSAAASVGRVGGQIAGSLPIMAVAPELAGAGRVGAGIDALAGGNKLLGLAGRGAVAGMAGAGLISGTSDEPLANQLIRGAETGAALGPIVGGAASLGNRLISPHVDPAVAGLAAKAEQYGIPLRPAQLTGPGSFLSNLDQKAGQLPFSGRETFAGQQQSAFTKAVARTFGEDTDSITPDVMTRAKDRLGKVFEDVASKTNIPADPEIGAGLASVLRDASQTLPGDSMKPLQNLAGEVWDTLGSKGMLTGKQYQQLTKKGSPLDVLQNSGNREMAHAATDLRDVLDSALERSAAPEDLASLKGARLQYKNMMTVAPLVVKGDEGAISPLLLNGRVNSSFKNRAFTGAGDLGDLAQIGQQFMRMPKDSGTPIGSAIINKLTSPGTAVTGLVGAAGTGYALDLPNMLLAAAAGGAGLGTTAATSRIVNSALGSQMLKNRLLSLAAKGSRNGNKLLNAASPISGP
jgi:hypothetical protein